MVETPRIARHEEGTRSKNKREHDSRGGQAKQ
jgi:hypothetical protein